MRIIIILTLIIYVSTAPLTVNEKILNVIQNEKKCPYLRSTIDKQVLSTCDDFQKTQNIKEVNIFNLNEALCGLYYNIFQSTCTLADINSSKDTPVQNQYNITTVCKSIQLVLMNNQIPSDFANSMKCENLCKIPMSSDILPICQASASMANIYLKMEDKEKSTTPSTIDLRIINPIERKQNSQISEIQLVGQKTVETELNLNLQKSKQSDVHNQSPQIESQNKLPAIPPVHQKPETERPLKIQSNSIQPQLQDPLPSQTPLPNQNASSSPILDLQNSQPSQNTQSSQNTQLIQNTQSGQQQTSQQTPNQNLLEDNDVFPESKDTAGNKANPADETLLPVTEMNPSNDLVNKPAEIVPVDETEIREDANSAEKQMAPPNVNDFDTHEDEYVDPEPEVVEKVKPVKPLKTDEDFSAVYPNQNMNDDDSYFFFYFMVVCVASVLGYVGYHNKQKILAIVLEGRKGRRSQRRRPNSANYHKLDCNLEEAVTSSCNKNTTNVIY